MALVEVVISELKYFFGCDSLAMTERGMWAQDSLPRNTFWLGKKQSWDYETWGNL